MQISLIELKSIESAFVKGKCVANDDNVEREEILRYGLSTNTL